jgi:hypothetical protein
MRRLVLALVLLLLLAFALPPIISMLEALIVPAIILTALVGIIMFLVQRRRSW